MADFPLEEVALNVFEGEVCRVACSLSSSICCEVFGLHDSGDEGALLPFLLGQSCRILKKYQCAYQLRLRRRVQCEKKKDGGRWKPDASNKPQLSTRSLETTWRVIGESGAGPGVHSKGNDGARTLGVEVR